MSTANTIKQGQHSRAQFLGLVVAAMVLAAGAFLAGRATSAAPKRAATPAAQAPTAAAQAAQASSARQGSAGDERDLGPWPDTSEGSNARASGPR